MSEYLGKDAFLAVGDLLTGVDETAADIVVSTDLTEVTGVKDLTTDYSAAEADASDRGSGGWRETLATIREGTINFNLNYNTDDTQFNEILDAWKGGNRLAFAVLDIKPDDVSDVSQGLVGYFAITNFSENQELESVQTVDVTIKLSEFGFWYDGGEPV